MTLTNPADIKSVETKRNILLYGDTGDGKTALIGEMAEWIYKTTGKKTRLFSADRGGTDTIQPYIDLGIIELEPMTTDPWIWINKSVRGYVLRDGKWIKEERPDIGLNAFESMTSVADALMQSLAQKASQGVNIGGGANVNFTITEGTESLKVGGNNMAHYGVVQTRIVEEVWQSQSLPGWLIWTASAKRDEDPNATGKLLGPAISGKALTGEVPRWFVYTFRVAAVPAQGDQPEKHILYLGDHTDMSSGNAKGLGNTRIPLAAPKLPTKLEPASLVKAIELIASARSQALDTIRTRIQGAPKV